MIKVLFDEKNGFLTVEYYGEILTREGVSYEVLSENIEEMISLLKNFGV